MNTNYEKQNPFERTRIRLGALGLGMLLLFFHQELILYQNDDKETQTSPNTPIRP